MFYTIGKLNVVNNLSNEVLVVYTICCYFPRFLFSVFYEIMTIILYNEKYSRPLNGLSFRVLHKSDGSAFPKKIELKSRYLALKSTSR